MSRLTKALGAALGFVVVRRPLELLGERLLAVAADDPTAGVVRACHGSARPGLTNSRR